jgi:hypothetical protein
MDKSTRTVELTKRDEDGASLLVDVGKIGCSCSFRRWGKVTDQSGDESATTLEHGADEHHPPPTEVIDSPESREGFMEKGRRRFEVSSAPRNERKADDSLPASDTPPRISWML